MTLHRMHNQYCTLAFATLTAFGGLGAVSAANAADGIANIASQAQYELEVQRCNSGQTNQDRAVCLQEAGAARDEAARKRLNDGQSTNYGNNAVDRCAKLPSSQRDDCMLQMRSPSTVKGSVESGGVLRETVIPVPSQPSQTTPGSMVPGGAPSTLPPNVIPPGTTVNPLPVQR